MSRLCDSRLFCASFVPYVIFEDGQNQNSVMSRGVLGAM